MTDNQNNGGSLGLGACIAMLVGGMIGSAIFSLSGLTMYTAGPAAIVSWIIAAAVMLIYGLIVSELSTIFPHSGGDLFFQLKHWENASDWEVVGMDFVLGVYQRKYCGHRFCCYLYGYLSRC